MIADTVRTEDFFQHARRGGTPATMTSATRYLCAAGYLDEWYCRRVIRELIDEEHRAVVPSYGFDVGPVVTHCLRARWMQLVRDLAIWTVLFAGAIVSPASLATYLSTVMPFAIGRLIPWRRFSWPWRLRIAAAAVALYVVVEFVVLLFGIGVVRTLETVAFDVLPDSVVEKGFRLLVLWIDPGWIFLWTVLIGVTMLVLTFGWQILVLRRIRDELRPGGPTPPPPTGREGQRTRSLTDAQIGNVTMCSGRNPFLGSGAPDSPWARAWSIAVELDRPVDAEQVDPVELHEHVRRYLIAMAEERPQGEDGEPDQSARPLPPNERIAGLSIDYHVVARGVCDQYPRMSEPGAEAPDYAGHPLIDGAGMPYSKATEASRTAIIRHPQGGIRCFQRVTVGAEGQTIRHTDGRVVAPAEDQDIVVSVFIYIAVEGHMLYVQFAANVLPPIRREYRVVDWLASATSGSLVVMAVRRRWLAALSDGVMGPFRAVRTIAQMVLARMRSGVNPTRFTTYDYGARVSVRELAAEVVLPTYLQVLDAHKYSRLVERRLNEAVLDHLQRRGVDVTAYRTQASQIVEQHLTIRGDNYGPINTGSGRQDNRGATIA